MTILLIVLVIGIILCGSLALYYWFQFHNETLRLLHLSGQHTSPHWLETLEGRYHTFASIATLMLVITIVVYWNMRKKG